MLFRSLTWPPEFSLTVLPEETKKIIKFNWTMYAEYIRSLNPNSHTIYKIHEVISFMESGNHQHLLEKAKSTLENKDKIRKEDFTISLSDLKNILK